VGINLKNNDGVLREHYHLYANDDEIGYITSGGWAQTLKKSVGLALVKKEYSPIGTEFEVEIRNKRLTVVVVSTPFYKRETN
jgi:aminomethyltransferase